MNIERIKKHLADFENNRPIKVKYLVANKETAEKIKDVGYEIKINNMYANDFVFLNTGEGVDLKYYDRA